VQLGKTTIHLNSLTGVQTSGLMTGMILITRGDETNPRLQTEEKIAATCTTAINLRNIVGIVQGD
jgi:translation initiation factor 2 gamma subunit (eIF-2gamma)